MEQQLRHQDHGEGDRGGGGRGRRGRGRRRGGGGNRQGRRQKRHHQTRCKSEKIALRQMEMKFAHIHIMGGENERRQYDDDHHQQPTPTFDDVLDKICTYLILDPKFDFGHHGRDVITSLRDGKWIDLKNNANLVPKCETSTLDDETERSREQYTFDLIHKYEIEHFAERIVALPGNMETAYHAIFHEFCTTHIQALVKIHPDYDTKIYGDPVKLLEVIKPMTMLDTIRNPFEILTDSVRVLMCTKQGSQEELWDYYIRFKHHRDILKSLVGPNILDSFIELTPEYYNNIISTSASNNRSGQKEGEDPGDVDGHNQDDGNVEEENNKKEEENDEEEKLKMIKDGAFERWMAYIFLRGSDQSRYSSVLNRLELTYHCSPMISYGDRERNSSNADYRNNIFPKTLYRAYEILRQCDDRDAQLDDDDYDHDDGDYYYGNDNYEDENDDLFDDNASLFESLT
jgi:hypothetical protein